MGHQQHIIAFAVSFCMQFEGVFTGNVANEVHTVTYLRLAPPPQDIDGSVSMFCVPAIPLGYSNIHRKFQCSMYDGYESVVKNVWNLKDLYVPPDLSRNKKL